PGTDCGRPIDFHDKEARWKNRAYRRIPRLSWSLPLRINGLIRVKFDENHPACDPGLRHASKPPSLAQASESRQTAQG
ncbi:MAG: hypothetical protein QF754_05095, partial [Alphaproteobacteria bacterium]|nr:hypothetical protein [Alphaproteobacteria bacterium]